MWRVLIMAGLRRFCCNSFLTFTMTSSITRKIVWNSLLDADYQKRYWQLKSNKFASLDRILQIILAISSSAGLLTAFADFRMMLCWKVLSTITAILAVALPFCNLSRRSIDMAQVANLWHELELEYDELWRSLDVGNFHDGNYTKVKQKELEIGKKVFDLPFNDKKIQKICFKQVLDSRGLENEV